LSLENVLDVHAPRGELIGLGGKLRAGKDAVADYLVENKNFVKLGMSDALNEALLKLNPWIPYTVEAHPDINRIRYADLHEWEGYVEAKKNPEVRRLLQVLGTEVGRDMIDQNVWVNLAEKRIRQHWAEGKNVVITAMRFPNELEMVQRLSGTNVWVNRPSEAHSASESTIHAHASENSVTQDDFELTIENTGTLEDLYNWTEAILDGLSLSRHAKSHEVARGEPLHSYADWPRYDH
jgi:hypothetical protein